MIDIQDRLARLPERFNERSHWVHRARRLTTCFLLTAGASSFRIHIGNGRIDAVQTGPFIMAQWDFCIQADEDTWHTFWQPLPPPGFHDVMALSKAKRMSIQGNIYPFMSNLLYFKELLATARTTRGH